MGPDNGPEPPDMTPTGREWWDAIAVRSAGPAHEVALLRRVVAIADRITRLEQTVEREGDLVAGRDGPKGNPALAEIRQSEALLAKIVAQLRIPDDQGVRPQTRGGHRSAHQGRRTYRSDTGRIGPIA
jgi:hypothetical protein